MTREEMERRRDRRPLPLRTLEADVLTLHVVLGAALAGRTTPEHAARAARRAHQSARAFLWPATCPVCGGRVAFPRPWAIYQGEVVRPALGSPLASGRIYCSREHAAWSLEAWS